MDPIDDIVRDALKALEAKATPRDYFEELPGRIHVRLEGSMQTDSDREHDAIVPSIADGVVRTEREESSGLHDIKALAQTTKNRISRRTSQHDIDETLLSASQSGLHAVALPDPAKMVQLPTVEEARRLARSTTNSGFTAVEEVAETRGERPAIAAREPAAERSKGVPVWMWAGGGLAAAAAAVMAFVVLGNRGGDAEPKADEPAVAEREQAPAKAAAAAPAPVAEPAPAAAEEGIATAGIAEGEATGTVAPSEALADPAPEPVKAVARDEARKKERSAGGGGDKADQTDKVKADRKTDPKVDTKNDKGGDTKSAPADDAKKKLEGAVLGAGDSDELGIGDALGGGGAKKKDEAPAKTELTNQEVRDGLDAINGKAKACYGSTGQTGTVKVKLTISPSGKVTKASASGDLAGTPAADCVIAAVKSAEFPAWDGAPKSTAYVVLLSD